MGLTMGMILRLIILFSLLITGTVTAQVEITYLDVSLYRNDILKATVFVQNLGPMTTVWSLCTDRFGGSAGPCDFLLRYEDISINRNVEHTASSITIKTIFGTSIPMDTPVYELETSGATSGQEWEILFGNIPADAGNMVVSVLGVHYFFGDMRNAEKARENRKNTIKSLIFSAHVSFNANEFKDAAEKYERAISLSDTLLSSLAPRVAMCYAKLGEESYRRARYSASIAFYSRAISFDRTLISDCSSHQGNSYRQLAEDELASGKYKEAAGLFRNAVKSDPTLSDAVNIRFQRIRRSPMISGLMSIVPGGGQLANGQYRKAGIHFGVFALLTAVSISNLAEADRNYEDYLKATNSGSAQSYYKKTDEAWKVSVAFGGYAIGMVLWSVVDAYRNTTSFNDHFEPIGGGSSTSISLLPIPSNDIYGLRLCVHF